MDDNRDIWDGFDYVGVAGYLPYFKREESMRSELSRVGLADRAVWNYEFPNPFNAKLLSHLKRGAGIGSIGAFSCTMNHYHNLKVAQGLGSRMALLFEDDMKFLKDVSVIRSVVEAIPDDADVLLFDWFRGHMTTDEDLARLRSRPRVNGYWARANDLCLVSFGMVGLNGKGMDWLIRSLERGAGGRAMRATDAFFRPQWNEGVNIYAAFPHVAIQGQVEFGVHKTSKHYDEDADESQYGA